MAGRGLVQQPVGNPLPGSTALVHYDIPGDQTWHTRILLAHVVAGEWVIVTPDGDLYIEDFGPNNPDIDAWRHYDPAVGPPFGIDPAHIYAFHPMPDHVTLQRLIAEGGVHAAHERLRRGLGVGAPGAAVGGAVAGGGGVGAGDGAVVLANGGAGAAIPAQGAGGNVNMPVVNQLNPGGAAPAAVAAPMDQDTDDARTLTISRNSEGVRFKEFRAATQECRAVEFIDWPIAGPRTVKHVITEMLNHGGSPSGHHQAWRVACKFQPSDAPAQEHEAWCKVLESMLVYDQLDVTNLSSAELVVRAIQRIEERHKLKITATDDAGESALFMGAGGGMRAGLVVSPKLTEWIGSEMQKEALVAKERRKAREERQLSRKGEKKEDK